jgi:hypothetical protein
MQKQEPLDRNFIILSSLETRKILPIWFHGRCTKLYIEKEVSYGTDYAACCTR